MIYPMKLKAALKDYLWGGSKLKQVYHKETTWDTVAESWELSCHKDGASEILNGPAAGQRLPAYIEEQGRSVLGTKAEKFPDFPILVKLIDAKESLSVQVHPDNEYALRVEGEFGKTEMWYIVDCEPGASLLYGFKEKIGQAEFRRRIEEGSLLEVCNRVPVKKGDVFFIEAGTLHAIGKGILIAEIQQNSNTTYRIYDYDRRDKDGNGRELHVDKAVEVTKLEPPSRPAEALLQMDVFADYKLRLLARCEYFTVYHFDLHGEVQLRAGTDSFHSLTVLAGEVVLRSSAGEISLRGGESAFLPAGLGKYSLTGTAEFLLSML